jgi:hypothetical protein
MISLKRICYRFCAFIQSLNSGSCKPVMQACFPVVDSCGEISPVDFSSKILMRVFQQTYPTFAKEIELEIPGC